MKKLITFLLLLSITPWFLTLIINRPSFQSGHSQLPWPQQISANLTFYTSAEFLFFSGDGRPDYGTGDHGVFLLSFLPLILIGAYHGRKIILWWFVGGLTLASFFSQAPNLHGALWYLPALSILAAIGAGKLSKSKNTTLQCMVFMWLLYEAIRLYHVILIHKPFAV